MQKIFTPYRKAILTSCLLVLFGIGIILRLHNISPFKIYPDSYQSLLTALNIKDYHSVVGFLGKDGMVYPDFFGWTRPFYPLLILAASMFFHTIASSAQYVAVLAGILALPLAFFLGRHVFKSFAVGVGSILLLTLSYNHTVWGGFILTETLAVFSDASVSPQHFLAKKCVSEVYVSVRWCIWHTARIADTHPV